MCGLCIFENSWSKSDVEGGHYHLYDNIGYIECKKQ